MEEAFALEAPFFFREEEPAPIIVPEPEVPWWKRFVDMDQYDWNDPGFKRRNRGRHAFLPVPLTKGFFMIVPRGKYHKMTVFPDGRPKKWQAKVDTDESGRIIKVYGRRGGRVKYGEPRIVYASRELLGVLHGHGDVDHVNGWSLDNRWAGKDEPVNLEYVSTRKNGSNSMQSRRVHTTLKRGVEPRGLNRDGKPRYGGIYAIRLSKKRVKTVRTKMRWLTQEPAHRWYLNQLKRRYGRTAWAFASASVNYPLMPPLLDSEPAVFHRTRAQRIDKSIRDMIATF